VIPRSLVVPLAATLLLATACATAEGPSADGTTEPRAQSDELQAYPYTTPTPPSEATLLDGTYTRENDRDVVGGSGKCRRCPPYRLALGRDVLELERGVFRVSHEGIGYLAVGHYTLAGNRVTLFNDPNCSAERGTYAWSLEDGVLRLEVVEDDCAFGDVRVRYLTAGPWTRSTEST
jgi:hypothetical protein